MTEQSKLSKQITGIAGEYYVAAELSRRGFMASITLRNNDSVDIHASNITTGKIFAIQVKTNQYGKRNWMLNSKVEKIVAQNLFYIFVTFGGKLEHPEYTIIPSMTLADIVSSGHSKWLKTPNKKNKPHNDTPVRNFTDKNGVYLEKWELLT